MNTLNVMNGINAALILSGGSASRFGNGLLKQYRPLCGKEVIAYSVEAMKNSQADAIVIVCEPASAERLSETYGADCVAGGKSRNASLKNGLDFIKNNYPNCNKVLINEAARPFLTAELAGLYFNYLDKYDAVITAQHITDSLGCIGEAVTDRSRYYLIQAPEAFRFELLYRHFKADSPITATVQQLPPESSVMKHFEFKNNMKITYMDDLLLAEQLMKAYR